MDGPMGQDPIAENDTKELPNTEESKGVKPLNSNPQHRAEAPEKPTQAEVNADASTETKEEAEAAQNAKENPSGQKCQEPGAEQEEIKREKKKDAKEKGIDARGEVEEQKIEIKDSKELKEAADGKRKLEGKRPMVPRWRSIIMQKEDEDDMKAHGKARPGPIVSEHAQKHISWDGGTINLPKKTFSDRYNEFLAVILSPFILLGMIFASLGSLPLMSLCYLYSCSKPGPVNIIKRNISFRILSVVCFILNFPKFLLGIAYGVGFFLLSHILGAPVGLLVQGPSQIAHNFKVLWPFMGYCPLYWSDVLCAVIGGQHRQGFWKFFWTYATAMTVDPFLKWFMICNPWYMKLDVRYVNQWTDPIDSQFDSHKILHALRTEVSRAIHKEEDRETVEQNVFSAHYQLPGRRRRPRRAVYRDNCVVQTALGFQFTSSLAHFTHSGHAPADLSVKPYSTTAKHLVYPVSLYYFNPCHMLTAYVEVNIQPNHAMEHPMWSLMGEGYYPHWFYSQITEVFFLYAPQVQRFVLNHVDEEDSRNKEKDNGLQEKKAGHIMVSKVDLPAVHGFENEFKLPCDADPEGQTENVKATEGDEPQTKQHESGAQKEEAGVDVEKGE